MLERKAQIAGTLKERFDALLKETGDVLIAVNVKRRGRAFDIEILMDHQAGGVTIEDCARFNRVFSGIINDEGLVPEEHDLTVASPGLDWPLSTEQDFRRVAGRRVTVDFDGVSDKKFHYAGSVEGVEDNAVLIRLDDGGIVSLPIPRIKKATQDIYIGKRR